MDQSPDLLLDDSYTKTFLPMALLDVNSHLVTIWKKPDRCPDSNTFQFQAKQQSHVLLFLALHLRKTRENLLRTLPRENHSVRSPSKVVRFIASLPSRESNILRKHRQLDFLSCHVTR